MSGPASVYARRILGTASNLTYYPEAPGHPMDAPAPIIHPNGC